MPQTQDIELALRHLRRRDAVLREVIRQAGPYTLRPNRDRFAMLARSILSQQLSTKVARVIIGRFEAALPEGRLTAAGLAAMKPKQMRAAGASNNKAAFLADLADAALTGRINLARIGRKSDEEIIAELTQVHGIGRWTAQMFLMFSLHRPDVFPADDLGIRTALKNLYALPELPTREVSDRIALPWRPYATIASWYCWRSLELPRQGG